MSSTRRRAAAALAASALILFAAGPAPAAGPDLLTWGYNAQGELGDGTTTNRTTPVFPTLSPGLTISAIDGSGSNTSHFVTSTGAAFGMGENNNGELGDATTTNRTTAVAPILPGGTVVTDVKGGFDHTLFLTSAGTVYATGYNGYGQLGDGTLTQRTTPVLVTFPGGTVIAAIAAGWNHSMALDDAGGVWTWGRNHAGQLGDGTVVNISTPATITLPPGTTVAAIVSGGNTSRILTDTGAVLGWGENNNGEIGDGTTTGRTTPVSTLIPVGTTVAFLGSGSDSGFAVSTTGTPLAWGYNGQGQLGDGTTTQRLTPVTAILPPGTVATAVASGRQHTLWLTTAGKVYASGRNSEGQLADGTTTQRTTPIASQVGSGTTLNLVATGSFQSLAVGTFSLTGVPLAQKWIWMSVLGVLTLAFVCRRRHDMRRLLRFRTA